ncbi:DUF1648 domain-containing protein [Nesterenkonia alba]|uniref:DUF1648 domain-containing protein n=1 Tax=Nesterenkonia alba TaxID=515814 RepID=UPI0003B7B8DE|nr:DUF1648 domain-containing protein [Nesterenkonia alba]
MTTPPSTAQSERASRPHPGRRWLLGVILPALITAGAFTLVLLWLPRLPEEVALHWGPQGVNRTGSVGELIGILGGMAVLSLVVLALFAILTGRTAFIRRLVLGLAVGMAVFMSGMFVVPVAVQLNLSPGETPGSIDIGMLISTGAALAAGLLSGLLGGKDPEVPAAGPVAGEHAELAPGERAVWVKHVGPSQNFKVWGLVAVVLYVGFTTALSWWAQSWFTFIFSMAPLLLALVMLVWTVRIDSRGLTAHSVAGWPKLHVPAVEIEGAKVRENISPMGEFGGWGIRGALDNMGGKVGVVIRGGEGIEIARSANRTVVITVDDAATGAALLNTKATRARQN